MMTTTMVMITMMVMMVDGHDDEDEYDDDGNDDDDDDENDDDDDDDARPPHTHAHTRTHSLPHLSFLVITDTSHHARVHVHHVLRVLRIGMFLPATPHL